MEDFNTCVNQDSTLSAHWKMLGVASNCNEAATKIITGGAKQVSVGKVGVAMMLLLGLLGMVVV